MPSSASRIVEGFENAEEKPASKEILPSPTSGEREIGKLDLFSPSARSGLGLRCDVSWLRATRMCWNRCAVCGMIYRLVLVMLREFVMSRHVKAHSESFYCHNKMWRNVRSPPDHAQLNATNSGSWRERNESEFSSCHRHVSCSAIEFHDAEIHE